MIDNHRPEGFFEKAGRVRSARRHGSGHRLRDAANPISATDYITQCFLGRRKTLIVADSKRKICVFSVNQRPGFKSVR
jgi:hypothetical protein